MGRPRIPHEVKPCPRCGKEISCKVSGNPLAHKCPHGKQCVWPVFMAGIDRQSECQTCRELTANLTPSDPFDERTNA